ncbi:MAG: SDR family oxidoreductase [Bacteroidetes bacterium]|nr:SDR family oxidoreductase [Bacteroidota bacterium]
MKKVSVVSGGASGLGYEIASLLVKAGKNVIILGRNNEKLLAANDKLMEFASDNQPEAMVCNIGNECDIKKVGDYLVRNNLQVEYLFNNAGMGLFVNSDSLSASMVDKVFEANVKGMILLTSEVLRMTPEEEELTIVNIMSTSALVGRAEETIYCAAKWGARGFTEALRVELKGKKRNIIAVYPGGMRTDFWNMPGKAKDLSAFMDPAMVAEKIVNAVMLSDKMLVTDITINRR